MPTLSEFYGIKIMMYYMDTQQHDTPHFHAFYGEHEVSIAIESGEAIIGHLPRKKLKLVQAWTEIHYDELIMNWQLASSGEAIQKINPLK
jgi:hypothetical protein